MNLHARNAIYTHDIDYNDIYKAGFPQNLKRGNPAGKRIHRGL